jgi:hypothetical protein
MVQVLQPNELANIHMTVKLTSPLPGSQAIHRVRVHCVDVSTRELIYAWLFELELSKPVVQRAYRIDSVAGRHTPYKFPYSNPLSSFVMLEFVSSKPTLMEVRREKQGFEANVTRQIELMVPAQLTPANGTEEHEVLLYVNSDQGSQVSETLLFKILVKSSGF